jgi:hypothetical protein
MSNLTARAVDRRQFVETTLDGVVADARVMLPDHSEEQIWAVLRGNLHAALGGGDPLAAELLAGAIIRLAATQP